MLYRSPADYQNADADVAAWNSWLGGIGADLLDLGRPVTHSAVVGADSPDLRVTGYSIIAAAGLESATALAARCPALAGGGAVEVGALIDLPEGHGQESA
jgi:hypothetical protein